MAGAQSSVVRRTSKSPPSITMCAESDSLSLTTRPYDQEDDGRVVHRAAAGTRCISLPREARIARGTA